CERRSAAQFGSGRSSAGGRGSEAGRHSRRQNHTEIRDRTGAGRTVVACDFWRKSRGREGHVADCSVRNVWNSDGRESFFTPRSFAREVDADGNETSAQNDHGRSSQKEGGADRTVN